MPHDRFYLDAPLENEVVLEGDEAHHLLVMRKKLGDQVELVNGKGALAIAVIVSLGKTVKLRIEKVTIEKEAPYPIILAQALPRLNKLDFIIEKGVEIGATTFWLFPADKSEKKDVKDLSRLKRIAIASMKQCGRLDLPEIIIQSPITSLKQFPFPAYFGSIEGAPFNKVWSKKNGTLFFIGPESGFSDREIAHLKNLRAIETKLSRHVLRTETAPLVALSLISSGE